jgi:outer membrane protein assembly factor BamE (lipoprotein component of BamABCDE complex)
MRAMKIIRFLEAAVLAMCLAGCSTPSSPHLATTPVRRGMTSNQVLAAFGQPLQILRNPDGEEDWYYNFGTQERKTHPISESTSTETEHSYSTGQTITTTTTMTKLPIHFSGDGHVVGEIPAGSVVIE